jgi:hypothetical protein
MSHIWQKYIYKHMFVVTIIYKYLCMDIKFYTAKQLYKRNVIFINIYNI